MKCRRVCLGSYAILLILAGCATIVQPTISQRAETSMHYSVASTPAGTVATTIPTTVPTAAPMTEPATEATRSPIPETPIVTLHTADYTYTDMTEDLQLLQQAYPQWLHLQVYGTSCDGRELLAATLGSPDAPKQIIITAGMHAGEYINPYLVMLQLEYYLSNYETGTYGGKLFSELFSQTAIVVVPMSNPDGTTLVLEGLASIRNQQLRDTILAIARRSGAEDVDAWLKRYWKCNAAGVDLNRNYDIFTWGDYVEYSGYLQRPDFQFFKGYSPNSEPETQALIKLTEALSNPVASVCVHSRGNIVYWRCYQEGAFAEENRALAQIAADVTGYGIIHENQVEPSYSNWTILAHKIPTLTVETGYHRPLPMDIGENIGEIYDRNRDLWAAIALAYQEAE